MAMQVIGSQLPPPLLLATVADTALFVVVAACDELCALELCALELDWPEPLPELAFDEPDEDAVVGAPPKPPEPSAVSCSAHANRTRMLNEARLVRLMKPPLGVGAHASDRTRGEHPIT